MFTVYDLKPAFQSLLRPLVNLFAKIGITANQVTFFTILLSVLTGGIVYFQSENTRFLILVPIVLFLRMALNAIDGMLAREHNMKTRFGAILNELGDVLSDSFLYLPLAVFEGFSNIAIVIAVLLSVITEMTGVISIQIGGSRRYDGPMGKSDRAFWFGLVCLLIGLGIKPGLWNNSIIIIINLLLIVTVFNRGYKALKEVEK